ncbi:MAG: hypothetical protein BWY70_01167 [Bacteroidetes bacterium ADurb.Bin408]|nr:MAG: hypothetical protein BWY70_01167 [Bacteroidetes bacterium ADurb.Bin408]
MYKIKYNICEYENRQQLFTGTLDLPVVPGDFIFIKTYPFALDSLISDTSLQADLIRREPSLDVEITGISKCP